MIYVLSRFQHPTIQWLLCYTMHIDEKSWHSYGLGKYDDYIMSKLKDSDLLMIEANHDILLMVGRYPIISNRGYWRAGHLSNDTSTDLIGKLVGKKNQHIIRQI